MLRLRRARAAVLHPVADVLFGGHAARLPSLDRALLVEVELDQGGAGDVLVVRRGELAVELQLGVVDDEDAEGELGDVLELLRRCRGVVEAGGGRSGRLSTRRTRSVRLRRGVGSGVGLGSTAVALGALLSTTGFVLLVARVVGGCELRLLRIGGHSRKPFNRVRSSARRFLVYEV